MQIINNIKQTVKDEFQADIHKDSKIAFQYMRIRNSKTA